MRDETMKVAIQGAGGRMGQRLVALVESDPALSLACTFTCTRQINDHAIRAKRPDVLIDFSSASALRGTLAMALATGTPLVVGTTGLSRDDLAELDRVAETIPLLEASNFSLVVNVLHHLARQAVGLLGEGWDLEIVEAHHRFKKDAPSGTALALANTLAEAAGRDPDCIQLARHGDDAVRHPNDITVQTVRIGDHPGEHTIYMAGLGERLELKHVATSRESYALGALRAAKWLAGKPAGRYAMADVLGL